MRRNPLKMWHPPAKAAMQPANARPAQTMTHGDILYRLSLIAPDTYRALETLAREKYKELWPLKEDPIDLRQLG